MEILRGELVDISTPRKQKKAIKALKMFNQNFGTECKNCKSRHLTYFPHINRWVFVSFKLELNSDIIQPSELKQMLARELLKVDDVIIIEGHKPERTRWIACIKDVAYYGDEHLKFKTTEATGLNNPSYRVGSTFAGKFKRFATPDEVAKLVEAIAINTNKSTGDQLNPSDGFSVQYFQNHFYGKYFDPKISVVPLTVFYTQLPSFETALKIDLQQKRERLEKELFTFAANRHDSDCFDALNYWLLRQQVEINKSSTDNPIKK